MNVLRECGLSHFVKPLFALVLASLVAGISVAQDNPPAEEKPTTPGSVPEEQVALPKLKEMPLPEAEELLRSRPVDWIVLTKTQEVLVVDPLIIRPDLIGRVTILHDMAQQTYNRVLKSKPYKDAELASLRQYLGKNSNRNKEFDDREAAQKQELDNIRDRVEELKPTAYKFTITLRDGSVDPEYQLDLRNVDSVVYYEDLLLRRADLLIAEGRTPLAYDLLMLVARRYREAIASTRANLESDEQNLIARIKVLEGERNVLRKSRDELNAPKLKNSPAAKVRLTALEKTVVAIASEIKDLEEEIRGLRYKLRFVRPKDFPNPEPPRKDDLILSNWPRFDEVYQRLVFKDSDEQFRRNRFEESLRLLVELWRPGVENAELSQRLGRVTDQLMTKYVEKGDYRQARHFLGSLIAYDAANPVNDKWRQELNSRAVDTIQRARTAASQGDTAAAARTVDLAARIWPDASGLKDAHRELTERHQILRVGVLELADEQVRPGLPTEAEEREKSLTEIKLFEPTGISDQGVRYRSSFFEAWEPTDLGRRVQFRLKAKRADWESRALVTSADLHAELMSRIRSDSRDYDERLAGFVDGIAVLSPTEFAVNLRQLPLRPEALWQLTVAVGEATRTLNSDIKIGEVNLGRLRFRRTNADNNQVVYGRVRTQPATTRQRRVEEIIETRYDSWDKSLQGLLRGEVSMLLTAAVEDLKAIQDDGRFYVTPYAMPRSHFLLFNPKTPALLDGQLRRALLHGIPRDQLLKEHIQRGVSSYAQLVTCPFASKSYGYNRQLPHPDYDPSLAAALALTAKKQLGGTIPALRMICPRDTRVRAVAAEMVENWRRVGIDVLLLDDPDSIDWDLCYRTAKSVEPLMDIWPMLTIQDSARVDGLQSLSESTRRTLLELERTIDWNTATKLLHRLLGDLLIEARYIPLWEVEEYLVSRKNIVGIPNRPMHSYDDIERWVVQSWYSQEAP